MAINQNVPDLRRRRHQQRLPASLDLHEQQPVQRRRHVELSRPARDLPAATAELVAVRVSYALSKSMNNLGEAFFSPRPTPQCHEGLGALRQRPAPPPRHQRLGQHADDAGDYRVGADSHGFQASTMVQYYSALPFNIVSGVNSLQGTAGRPLRRRLGVAANFDVRDGRVHSAERGHRQRLLHRESAGHPVVPARRRQPCRGIVEAFNLTDRVNSITRNTTFGAGSYPSNPFRHLTP